MPSPSELLCVVKEAAPVEANPYEHDCSVAVAEHAQRGRSRNVLVSRAVHVGWPALPSVCPLLGEGDRAVAGLDAVGHPGRHITEEIGAPFQTDFRASRTHMCIFPPLRGLVDRHMMGAAPR